MAVTAALTEAEWLIILRAESVSIPWRIR